MRTLDICLYIAAIVCLGLATVGVAARVNLVALGLLLAFLVPLIALIQAT